MREIVAATKRMRPDLRIDAAFTAGAKPNLERVVASLAARGHDEVVVVPLLVTTTEQAELEVLTAVDEATRANPATRVRAC